ncbi:ABC transporter permease [Streptomyces virginiae]|uniref:ABC transporter permease n=2 Tax=Streptomyces TaxID=1883 RepID=A0ABQ3NL09_STRVG|nr:ABC transporter permease [Streptomyces sp. WM6349]KOU80482.1 ABC transporter permease [Streptomyces sp. XY593]KOU97979.1 ABC transporter permease [Streptomyces sp. XY511]KOV08095.1 ABC transporter permease [Streptomyces sp. XY533]KOV36960.1 ABC transporter permease [Streptomyces sp. H036]GGQ36672.1 ABC transporter permease [Streptomyces virginiae]GLV95046.1 ABC transporter permease [Streptomyces lavendulae subsp. lavendulae]
MAATLLTASFVVFGAMYLAPGSPASFLLAGRSASPEALAAINAQYHLDDPFLVRYFRWLGGVLQGDFGRSITYRTDVSRLLADRLPVTLLLITMALVLVVAVGLLLGRIAAVRGGAADSAVLVTTTFAVGTPSFVAAVLLQGLFAVQLGWFPSSGSGDGLGDMLWHLTLPAIALALYLTGMLARVTRSAMLEALDSEHVTVARSRGVPERQVIRRHVFRNSLGTVLTTGGLIVSTLLVCTILVETAFGIGGIGQLLELSTTTKDFPTVQAVSLIIVALFMVVNLVVDLLLPLVDPRVTLGSRKAAA